MCWDPFLLGVIYFGAVLSVIETSEIYSSTVEKIAAEENGAIENISTVYPKLSEALIFGERVLFVQLEKWLILFQNSGNLHLASNLKAEWVHANSLTKTSLEDCYYKRGTVCGMESVSRAAVSICASGYSLTGYFEIKGILYYFQPTNETTGEHVLFKRNVILADNNFAALRNHSTSKSVT